MDEIKITSSQTLNADSRTEENRTEEYREVLGQQSLKLPSEQVSLDGIR